MSRQVPTSSRTRTRTRARTSTRARTRTSTKTRTRRHGGWPFRFGYPSGYRQSADPYSWFFIGCSWFFICFSYIFHDFSWLSSFIVFLRFLRKIMSKSWIFNFFHFCPSERSGKSKFSWKTRFHENYMETHVFMQKHVLAFGPNHACIRTFIFHRDFGRTMNVGHTNRLPNLLLLLFAVFLGCCGSAECWVCLLVVSYRGFRDLPPKPCLFSIFDCVFLALVLALVLPI